MKLIRLAQPGVTFERNAPDSPWMTDRDFRRVRQAVVKRRLPKGVVSEPNASGGISHFIPQRNSRTTETISVKSNHGARKDLPVEGITRSLRPIKASDQRNISGYKAVKYRQMIEVNPGKSIKKSDVGTDAQLKREIGNIRSKMAGELRGKHDAILSIRRQLGVNDKPLNAEQWGRVNARNRPASGIIARHKTMSQIPPEHVSEVQARLKSKTDSIIASRSIASRNIDVAIRRRVGEGVEREQVKAGRPKLEKDVLRSRIHEVIQPLHGDVIPTGSEKEAAYGHLANYMTEPGKRKITTDHIASIRKRMDETRAWNSSEGIAPSKAPGYRKKIEKKLLNSGELFGQRGATIPKATIKGPASYPALRKLGIGAAVATGVIGATGMIAARRKKADVQLSDRRRLIELARGDVYERTMRQFIGGTNLINASKETKTRFDLRVAAARGRVTKQMQPVQQKMASEHYTDFLSRNAGGKLSLQKHRDIAARELTKTKAVMRERGKIIEEHEGRKRQIEDLHAESQSLHKQIEKIQGNKVSPEDAYKNGRNAGLTEGYTNAQSEFVNTAKTTKEDFDRRVGAESEYHRKRAQQTIRKAKSKMTEKLILTGGAGVTTGVVAGRQTKKEKPMQFAAKDSKREVIRGATNMGISAGVTGAATGAILTLAGRRSSLGRSRIGLLPKVIVAGRSAGKIGAITGAAGLASSAVGTSILGAPRKGEGAAYTKRGALGGGIIGALGGATLGAVALKHGGAKKFISKHAKDWAPLNSLLRSGAGKRVGIGAAVGSVAGAAQMADEGQQVDTINSTRKKKGLFKFAAKDDDDPYHDIATGGVEGGVGILATDPIIQRIKTGAWESPLKDGVQALGKKALIGAGVGAAATGIIGSVLKKARAAKLANQDGQTQNFAVKQSVAADRYRKNNENADLNRRDANIARSVVAGGALGAVLKKAGGTAKTRAIIGAGAGAASVLGIRSITQKDQFNDRSHVAKVTEGTPWKAAAIGTGLIAASRLRSKLPIKFSDASKLLQFDYVGDSLDSYASRRRRPSEVVQAEKTWQHLKRASRVGSELIDRATGRSRLDERGREKRSEFSKPWVRNMIATGIIAGTFMGAKRARRFVTEAGEREVAQTGTGGAFSKLNESLRGGNATKAMSKMPGVSHVIKATRSIGKFAGQVKTEAAEATRNAADSLATKINKAAATPGGKRPAPAVTKRRPDGSTIHAPEGSPAAEKIDQKKRQANRRTIDKIARGENVDLDAILNRVIHLAEYVDDWDIRDPRGRSARIYAPGSQRRARRGKFWHEKKDNRDLLHKAELGGALVAGVLLAHRKRIAPSVVKQATHQTEEFIPGGVDEFVKKYQRLSMKLDGLLTF